MQVFFECRAHLDAYLDRLHLLSCVRCGRTGAFVRHGYIRGYVSPEQRGVRAWRVYCKPERGGCGCAPSIRLAGSLLRRCFSTAELWAFIRELCQAPSTKSAWEKSGIRMPLDIAYRLVKRLHLCRPVLRTCLCSRGPPPREKCEGSALQQVAEHLRSALGDERTISAYQQLLQKDFLAIA